MERNKQWRKEQGNKRYKRLLKKEASYDQVFVWTDDSYVRNPKWIDLYNIHWQIKWKHTRCLCSCYLCQSANAYNRRAFKKETLRILTES